MLTAVRVPSMFALARLDLLHLAYPTLLEMLSHCVVTTFGLGLNAIALCVVTNFSVNRNVIIVVCSSTESSCTPFTTHDLQEYLSASICSHHHHQTHINILYSINLLLSAFF